MSESGLHPPKLKTKVIIRQRKNVLYQVTYEILELFHAPNMSTVGKTLYAGLIETQAIDEVTLCYFSKNRTVEFYIEISYDWDTYELLINTSRSDIEVNSKISSIDQFIGRKYAFEKIYKMVLSTTVISSKEVSYAINSARESLLENKVGGFHPIKKGILIKPNSRKLSILPKS